MVLYLYSTTMSQTSAPLLRDQLCFRLYTVSRLVSRLYQPLLDELGLTYPQYLALLALWEQDQVPVSHLVTQLGLNTNTLTPLLKRLEALGLIHRIRSQEDSRQMIISLSKAGRELQQRAACMPILLKAQLGDKLDKAKMEQLQQLLDEVLEQLEQANNGMRPAALS